VFVKDLIWLSELRKIQKFCRYNFWRFCPTFHKIYFERWQTLSLQSRDKSKIIDVYVYKFKLLFLNVILNSVGKGIFHKIFLYSMSGFCSILRFRSWNLANTYVNNKCKRFDRRRSISAKTKNGSKNVSPCRYIISLQNYFQNFWYSSFTIFCKKTKNKIYFDCFAV
jgi:hypothetical protein